MNYRSLVEILCLRRYQSLTIVILCYVRNVVLEIRLDVTIDVLKSRRMVDRRREGKRVDRRREGKRGFFCTENIFCQIACCQIAS